MGITAREAIFSVKCFAAAMLAYYVALRIGLTRPYWAVTTSYIVAQPLAGAVLSKAVFRAIGTFIGGAVAVVLVPNLVDAPELLSLALGLWLGLCVYISLLDRTPRAYIFLLAGYTASIIGFPSVDAPGLVFTTAAIRVQEIIIGILSASLVHGLILPRTVVGQLLGRIDAILADAERWSRDSLALAGEATLMPERQRLAVDVAELHQLSIHLPFDTARLLPRVRTVRALQDRLSILLPLAGGIEDRIETLARTGGVPADIGMLLSDIERWLLAPAATDASRATAAALIARARALEPVPGPDIDFRTGVRLSLLARVGELVAAHQLCSDLRAQVRSPSVAPVTPEVAELLLVAGRRPLHRDHAMALRTGAGAVATIVLGCTLWIESGWKDGAGAVLIAGVATALFGSSDEPAPIVRKFLYGTVIGLVTAIIYAFAIFPRITAFPVLALLLSPALLALGVMLTRPNLNLVALGATLGFLGTVGLNDHYDDDFVSVVNGCVAQIVGTGFAVFCVQVFLTVGVEESARRLVRAGWRDMANRANLPTRPDLGGWISRMLDRIGLIAPRLIAQHDDAGAPLFAALADMRLGIAVGELRALRVDSDTPAIEAAITPVLAGVSGYYRAKLAHADTPLPDALLETIDQAIITVAAAERLDERRSGLLALFSVRRNLFPKMLGTDMYQSKTSMLGVAQ